MRTLRRRRFPTILAASKEVGPLLLEGEAVITAAAKDEAGQSKGPPAVTIQAYNGGKLRLNRWDLPVVVECAGIQLATQQVPLHRDHNPALVVGHADKVETTPTVIARGFMSGANAATKEIIEAADNGFPWKASIGAEPVWGEVLEVLEGEKVLCNGQEQEGPFYLVRKSTLTEISILSRGADTTSKVSIAASAAKSHVLEVFTMKFEQWIEAMGFKLADLTDAQKASLEAKFNAEIQAAAKKEGEGGGHGKTPPVIELPAFDAGEIRAQIADHIDMMSAKVEEYEGKVEAKQITEIRAAARKEAKELQTKAIREKWLTPRLDAELIRATANYEVALQRAERPKAPIIHSSGPVDLTSEVLEAAMLRSCQYPEHDYTPAAIEAGQDDGGPTGRMVRGRQSMFEPKVLEAADKAFKHQMGLQELLITAAWANGYQGRFFRNDPQGVLRAAFAPPIHASYSTMDISGILSNIMNKFLLQGFFFVESTWRRIGGIRPVNDFKTVTSYRLIGIDQYEVVQPGGQLKHGTLGNETYTNKADTYGLTLSIDRRDMINDDLGAISTVPKKLGIGSGKKINDIFWTIWLAENSGTFFSAAHKNYMLTGTALWDGTAVPDSTLTIDGMTIAEKIMMDMPGADGKPIGITPAICLTPTSLSTRAAKLFRDTEVRVPAASGKTTDYTTGNPHTGKFRPEVSRYLGNSAYTGYSQAAWYLLADPAELPAIETCFLNGQEAPTIETAVAEFDILGIRMRGYHDFGVSLQDEKAAVKSKGSA